MNDAMNDARSRQLLISNDGVESVPQTPTAPESNAPARPRPTSRVATEKQSPESAARAPRRGKPPARQADLTRLERPIQPMPAFVREALTQAGLLRAYRARPAYQQNDYLGWINRAKLPATREKRLRQMLEELQVGTLYMKMRYRPARP